MDPLGAPISRRRRARAALLTALLAAALTVGFVWGYQAHRERIFPYATLRSVFAVKNSSMHRREAQRFEAQALPVGSLSQAAAEVAALAEIGYVDGTYDASADSVRGVYRHDPQSAFQGLNLYYSRFSVGAALLDMNGQVVHQWDGEPERGPWQHVHLLDDGGVLVIVKARELQKLDRESRLIWRLEGDFHHDLDVRADGSIVVLGKRHHVVDAISPTEITVDVLVVELEADGTIHRETSILEALLASPYRGLVPVAPSSPRKRKNPLDVLHANHIEVMEGGADPVFGHGNLLVSMRTNSLVAVFDPEVQRVLWVWGPSNVSHQHHPNLLENGNLLIFDNGLRRSRIVELEPHAFRIVWQYGPNDDFYSKLEGSCQRLPNGNTLITESESGYVFEVTRLGDIVWGFANPAVRDGKVRESIWRMTRIERERAQWIAPEAKSAAR